MTTFTRRTFVQSTLATGALAGSGLLEWAKAWAQAAPWKPEKGAQLSLLRWKYFVQSEDDAFMALLDAFTKATGVKVTVTRESFEDIPPKASVAANTNAGPDLFWGLQSLPHLFPQKCVDVTDVAATAAVAASHDDRCAARGHESDRLRQRQHDELPHLGAEEGRAYQVSSYDG